MVQDFYRKVVEDSRKNEFLDYQNHFIADEVKRRVRNYRKKVVSLLGTR
ncbi:hypothetical protein LEP1GSC061_3104 [Leptospira wolffii serovar Khorat str. Khorat-H2]|nr:hypothetical protein LEP1GSC061_3104 [Leptospira wolffii serovar Khorat str. Khorat-H2]